jgi:hypothetical protein
MAEVRISELTAHSTGNLAATDLIEVSQDLGGGIFGSRKLTGLQLRNGIKTYKANLTQTGTSAPTATVFINTLSGTPTFSYVGVGSYTLTLTGEFAVNKVTVIANNFPNDGFVEIFRKDANDIVIKTYNKSLAVTNAVLSETSIIIEVHP